MDFDLSEVQAAWRDKGAALGRELAGDPAAARVVMAAGRQGLLDPQADLLTVAVAVEAVAFESPSAAVIFALHLGTALAMSGDERFSSLFRGETVAAVSLSSDDLPVEKGGTLSGRAPWVAPVTDHGIAVVGPRQGSERAAFAVALDAPGVAIEPVKTAALSGLVCGHVTFNGAAMHSNRRDATGHDPASNSDGGCGPWHRPSRLERSAGRCEADQGRGGVGRDGAGAPGGCGDRARRRDVADLEGCGIGAAVAWRRVDGEAGIDRGRPARCRTRNAGRRRR
jgi:hypothetical protein